MEINFESTWVKALRETCRQTKRIQVSMESVVPDVSDDIGRVFSVQPQLLLKSKDMTAHSLIVTGEVSAVVLYMNELANAVCDLHLSQSFSLEYELEDAADDMQSCVKLLVGSSEARTINPRKVSVSVEIEGELSVYRETEIKAAAGAPTELPAPIHVRTGQESGILANAVCEKTFVLNEQFSVQSGEPEPQKLLWQDVAFKLTDWQKIGSKILVKGELLVSVLYAAAEAEHPVRADFSAPFSQLIEVGKEQTDLCLIEIETTALYFNILDAIGGEKTIDAEVHALLQIVSCRRQEFTLITDAYSSRYPSALTYEDTELDASREERSLRLEKEDRIELPDNCAEVVNVLVSTGLPLVEVETIDVTAAVDVLFRSTDDTLSCVKRSLTLSGKQPAGELTTGGVHITERSFRMEEKTLAIRLCAELSADLRMKKQLENAVSMSLEEENPIDLKSYPALTAVRVDQESLWELAKKYHSSVESIEALNETEEALQGRILLIPKTL